MSAVSWSAPPVLLVGLLGRGVISWVTHPPMHKLPFLGRVHRVHPTDVELDVSTTVRFHPLDLPIGLREQDPSRAPARIGEDAP